MISRQAQAAETQFFESHQLYRSISNRMGTSFLSRQLNKVLVHHIRDAIPELKMRVRSAAFLAPLFSEPFFRWAR